MQNSELEKRGEMPVPKGETLYRNGDLTTALQNAIMGFHHK